MEKSIFLPDHFRVDNRSIGKDRTAQKREATSAADTNYKRFARVGRLETRPSD